MNGQTTTKARDDEAIGLTQGSPRPPHKVRFAWQQPAGGDRNGLMPENLNRGSAQDVCSYPESAFSTAPPR